MTNGFRKTYEMHPNPPAAMGWDDYKLKVVGEWKALLDSQEGRNERNIHHFLDMHPSLVPGAGRNAFFVAMISEPPLAGIGQKKPDFLWLAGDSLNFTPVFIEIESPRKQWFTQAGQPHHNLTQAMNQLGEWRAWLNRAENQLVFFDQFHIPDRMRRHQHFRPKFILIYGRRQELDGRPELNRLRAQFEREDQTVMTFDRLEPSHEQNLYISATKTQTGYRALAVPAIFKLSPMIAKDLPLVQDIADAIRRNNWMSRERQEFLIERVTYWEEWERGGEGGIMNGADWE
ncbi:MAG: Shedu anti-phage system protein SduA domain-containing protein [Terriglobales bacterium]|jgi:hypothetical protein